MKVLVIVLVIVVVLVVAALIWTSMKRKQDRVNRERADELRSQAASTAHEHDQQAARAREAEAQAEQARAQAQQAEQHAQEERLAHQQTAAQREEHLREADRLDPDVDHRADDYEPRLDQHGTGGATGATTGATTAATTGEHAAGRPPAGAIHTEGEPAGSPGAPVTDGTRPDGTPDAPDAEHGRHQA